MSIVINNVFISLLIMILLIIIVVWMFFKICEWHEKRIIKLSKEKYERLKLKENPNLFEQLYVQGYNDVAVEVLENVLEKNKVKHVYSLDFEAFYNKNYVLFTFNHKKHSIYYIIEENKVTYFIDSPKKYDHLEGNKEYEQSHVIRISVNDYESLELFFEDLIPSIVENINRVDEFENDIDLININPNTLEEIEDYRCYSKEMAILLNVLSLIMIAAMFWLTWWCIIEPEDFWVYYLIIGLLDSFVLFSYIYSFIYFFLCNRIKKDMKTQSVESIKGKPYKVKLDVNTLNIRYSIIARFCSGIKLYFYHNNKRIKLYFAHHFNVPTYKQKKEIMTEIINKELNLKYYKKSKMIIGGLESYRKRIKRIIDKKN